MSWNASNASGWGGGEATATKNDWGSGEATTANDGWSGGEAIGTNNGFGPGGFGDGADSGYTGFADNGLGDNAFGNADACYNCGETGHNKSDCPNPAKPFDGECRVCKQQGHMSKDCPNAGPRRCGNCRKEGHFIDECPEPLNCPRCNGGHKLRDCPEPMKCRHCEGEHMLKDCPTYIPMCKNCGQEGHSLGECINARKVDRDHLPELTPEQAWEELKGAITERDIDEVKEKLQTYVKSFPGITFVELEKALRAQDLGLHLVPLLKENLSITLCNMDLQGNLGKKYTVNYRFSDKPRRPNEKEGWPKDHAEVLERLTDAGDVVPIGKPKCSICGELGHISKSCEQEKCNEQTVVKCFNCEGEGHRVRDCPIPRVDKFACKNCKQPGHRAADCTEPRSAEGVECRKCNKMGHFSKDCPDAPRGCGNCGEEGHMAKECTEPRNMANFQCRNCDEYGHGAKECLKPRDMSRVQCQNCQEMGHFKSRCPNPHAAEDGFGDNIGGDSFGAANAGGDSWATTDNAVTVGGGDSWGNNTASGW